MAIKMDNEDKIYAEINMTPLIDIMLVLLIIFMVSSSISLESGLDIDLPKTKSQTADHKGDVIIISLDDTGMVSVQGKPVDLTDLSESIKKALAQTNSKTVIFEGDQKSRLGKMIEIMDLAKDAGAENFAIAADQVQ